MTTRKALSSRCCSLALSLSRALALVARGLDAHEFSHSRAQSEGCCLLCPSTRKRDASRGRGENKRERAGRPARDNGGETRELGGMPAEKTPSSRSRSSADFSASGSHLARGHHVDVGRAAREAEAGRPEAHCFGLGVFFLCFGEGSREREILSTSDLLLFFPSNQQKKTTTTTKKREQEILATPKQGFVFSSLLCLCEPFFYCVFLLSRWKLNKGQSIQRESGGQEDSLRLPFFFFLASP